MWFKKIISIFLILFLSLSLFSCRDSSVVDLVTGAQQQENPVISAPSDIFTAATGSDGDFTLPYNTGDTFDPYSCSTDTNRVIMPLIYEGLFSLDENFNYDYALCKAYTTVDNTMFRFSLRDACFSDGTEITLYDVIYSINRAREQGSRYSSRLSTITACYVSEGVLCIETSIPNPRLPALLDIPICKDRDMGVYSGAYYIDNSSGSRVLKANTYWWRDEKLPLDTIYLKGYSGISDLVAAFGAGEISLVTTDLTGTGSPGFSGDYDTWRVQTSTMIYIGFNTEKPVFSLSATRQLISLGIDRERITSEIYGSHGYPTPLPFPPYTDFYNENVAATAAYSPESITRMLEGNGFGDVNSNGYPDVETYYGWYDLNVDLVVNSESEEKVRTAMLISEEFAAMNIEVTVKPLSWSDYTAAIANGDFYMYLGEVTLSPDFSLYKLMGSDGVMNYGAYYSTEAEGYLRSGIYSTNFLSFFTRSVPFAPILFKDSSVLTHRGTARGLVPAQGNVFNNFTQWEIS